MKGYWYDGLFDADAHTNGYEHRGMSIETVERWHEQERMVEAEPQAIEDFLRYHQGDNMTDTPEMSEILDGPELKMKDVEEDYR